MRKTCILLLLSILALGCVPYSAAQVIPTLSGRVAIVIVIEGADYRVLADVDTPNLDALAREGSWTNNSLTTLPSSSTTAYASLATGAYPEVTRVVHTTVVNATEYHEGTKTEPEKTYSYLQSLNATTLIETANLHGVHTVVIVGKGESNVTLGKTQVAERYMMTDENSGTATDMANGGAIAHGLFGTPTFVTLTSLNETYDDVDVAVSWDQANTNSTHISVDIYWANGTAITDGVIDISWYAEYQPAIADYDEWIASETITALEDFNATVKKGENLLMLISMPATQWAAYEYGPNSEEYRDALENADLQVGRIVNRAKELELWSNTLLLVTSDHGIVVADPDETVLSGEHSWGVIKLYHWVIDAGGNAAHIYLKDPTQAQDAVNYVWNSTLGGVDRIYSRAGDIKNINGTLKDVHLDVAYSGDIFVMLKPPYQYWQKNKGAYGSCDTQRVPLYIAGWNTNANYVLNGQPKIIDIAPTVAAFLGIPSPEKAQGNVLTEAFFTPFAETAISASPSILYPEDATQISVSFSITDSAENVVLKAYVVDEEGGVVEQFADYPVTQSSEVKNFSWTANEPGTFTITSYLSLSINETEYVISWARSKLLVIEKVEAPYPVVPVVAACLIGIVPGILVIWISFRYKSGRRETVEPKKKK